MSRLSIAPSSRASGTSRGFALNMPGTSVQISTHSAPSNAPKYAINTYCTDVIQNRYSILFMPAFAINLFSQFVLRPLLTPMAKMWSGGN